MSEPARTPSRTARPRTAGLICLLALAITAAFASTSFAQLPSLPDIPGSTDPDDPGEPGGAPPAEDPQDPPEPAPVSPSKLDPFPVVVVAGRQGKRSTRVTELSVKGPRKARVVVRCLGSKCPVRRARATIPRSERLRIRKAERVYRARLTIEIRVTGTDRVGKYTKVRFRSGRTPARSDACLQPGETEPTACP